MTSDEVEGTRKDGDEGLVSEGSEEVADEMKDEAEVPSSCGRVM